MENKNRWFRNSGMLLPAVLITSLILAGCGQRADNTVTTSRTTETQPQTTTAAAVRETEAVTEKETVTETEKLITSVDYTSKDGSVKITLPDNTWKVTQDTDEMRVFQSGSKAIINIQHATTAAAMQSLKVSTSEDSLKRDLDSQYTSDNAYEIESFTNNALNNVNVYKYVIKFNANERMWAYSDTYAIIATDQAYVITGTVTDDNKALLKSVEDSVDSFRVLKDETLKQITSEKLVGTTQKTSETAKTQTDTTAQAELKTEKTYNSVSLKTMDITNVRQQPGTDAALVTTLDKDASVSVVGETANWYKVSINGTTGYIRKDLLTAGGSAAQTTTASSSETNASGSSSSSAELNTATSYGSSATLYATDGVNIRSNPGTDSSVISSLSTGNSVTVVGETDNWYIVNVNGTTGYVSKAYLTSDSSAAGSNTGSNTSNTGNTSNSGNSSNSGTNSGSGSSVSHVSGTVESAGTDTMTVITDDGKEYTVYYGDAAVSSTDGIYDGVYVDISLNASEASNDGTLYATNVTGY